MIEANDPNLKSWVPVPDSSDFPIQNLPFGICASSDEKMHACVAIGDHVLLLDIISDLGLLDAQFDPALFTTGSLNAIISLGKEKCRALRNEVSKLLRTSNSEMANHPDRGRFLLSHSDVRMKMPVEVGDYTDFYSSEDHARNVGTMFRDPNNALLPNWKHLPVAYHGRSSSIVESGVPIIRPKGQLKSDDNPNPTFGPTKLLDFELEMAFITHEGKPMGQSIATSEAIDHIFGMVIFNDWSARDIQKWEYVPLGPFLAKNFASSISPWVVTMDALEPYTVSGPVQEPEVLDYLKYTTNAHYDIKLDVLIEPEGSEATAICHSNYKHMYWNMAQQLAHHTVNGCPIKAGDMMASGTISGPTEDAYGSMLELSWRGSKSVKLDGGQERKFIADGDTVVMRAHSANGTTRIGFGEVRTKVLPAN